MKTYKVRVEVVLEPVETPMVKVSCGDKTHSMKLSNGISITKFNFEQLSGPTQLTIELLDKHPNDPTTAVIVKSVKLNDIEHIQNTYQGMYYPTDMAPRRDTYLAWNGFWTLDFTVPVYTWMHKTQGLGWIYD